MRSEDLPVVRAGQKMDSRLNLPERSNRHETITSNHHVNRTHWVWGDLLFHLSQSIWTRNIGLEEWPSLVLFLPEPSKSRTPPPQPGGIVLLQRIKKLM